MADDEKDPFEVFNNSTGSGLVRNPYPRFAELRTQCPVHEGMMGQLFDIPILDQSAFSATGAYYTACSYAAVSQVLLDGETVLVVGVRPDDGLVFGHSILEMDDPEHHKYRSLLQQAFSQKAMDRWERDLVAPVVARCIDASPTAGALTSSASSRSVSAQVIAGMLGLPDAELPRFHRLAVELISIAVDVARHQRLAAPARLLRRRPGAPPRAPARTVSVLATAELDGSGSPTRDLRVPAPPRCRPAPRRRIARRATSSTAC
jgi:cytochrome P450